MLAVGALGGLGRLGLVAAAVRALFNPASLFANGEQGAWYDPSDLSTLFQDSAGTTPVTAVEQPVGLMLDKRLGLVLGPELVTNGGFDSGIFGWTARRSAVLSHSSGRLRATNAGGIVSGGADTPISCEIGKMYRLTMQIAAVSLGRLAFVRVADKDMATAGVSDFRVSIPLRPAGTYSVTFTATQTQHFVFAQVDGGSNGEWVEFDNISVRELPGNHAFQTTAIDRPILRQDANGNFYLAANGTNTWMQTNSIDFSSTDKVTVFAGVRKLSDAAAGILCETSINAGTSSISGAFFMAAPESSTVMYSSFSKGSTGVSATPGQAAKTNAGAAPDATVITATHDISADLSTIRRNGVAGTNGTADKGTGNFGNHVLYLFRRGGTSLPFNGNFYGLLIRAALTSDAQTIAMERWLAPKTGVTIP